MGTGTLLKSTSALAGRDRKRALVMCAGPAHEGAVGLFSMGSSTVYRNSLA